MAASKRIVLGSGKLYVAEFTDATQIDTPQKIQGLCADANLIGYIKGGASLAYTPTFYTATDDLGYVTKTIITDEEDESDDPEQYVLLAVTGDDNVTRAKKAVVKSGMEGNYYTEITSDEVKEGDKIVITPGEYKDGDVLPIFDFNAALNKDKKSDEGGKDE